MLGKCGLGAGRCDKVSGHYDDDDDDDDDVAGVRQCRGGGAHRLRVRV